ncbi:unnamed protein product [Brugia timori]|nr:unnamed protein product [Brugia timori]
MAFLLSSAICGMERETDKKDDDKRVRKMLAWLVVTNERLMLITLKERVKRQGCEIKWRSSTMRLYMCVYNPSKRKKIAHTNLVYNFKIICRTHLGHSYPERSYLSGSQNVCSELKMATKIINLTVTSDSRQYPYEKRYPSSITLLELKEKLVLVVGGSIECMRTDLRDRNGEFISSLTDDQATLEKLGVTDDSVRAWKRRLKIKYNALAAAENEAKQFKIGDRCVVHVSNQKERKGIVSYIGSTKFKDGCWIGVTYDEPFGKHDGSIDGERYFTCQNNHGVFVRPRDVKKCEDEEMEEI